MSPASQVWCSCVTLTSAVSHPKYHSGIMVGSKSSSKHCSGCMGICTSFFGGAKGPDSYSWFSHCLDGFRTPLSYLVPFPSPQLLTAAKSPYFSPKEEAAGCMSRFAESRAVVSFGGMSGRERDRGPEIGEPPKWVSKWAWEMQGDRKIY